MKQTTLEDLYYGNINPNEICFVRGSEYGKCFDKVAELSKSVCSQLSEEYINKMNSSNQPTPEYCPKQNKSILYPTSNSVLK